MIIFIIFFSTCNIEVYLGKYLGRHFYISLWFFCFFTSVQITDTEKNVEFFMLLLFLGHIHQYCKISLQEICECNFLKVKKIKRGIYCIYYICIIEILGGFMLYEMNLWKVQKTVSTWGFLFQTYIHYIPSPLLVRPPIVWISL